MLGSTSPAPSTSGNTLYRSWESTLVKYNRYNSNTIERERGMGSCAFPFRLSPRPCSHCVDYINGLPASTALQTTSWFLLTFYCCRFYFNPNVKGIVLHNNTILFDLIRIYTVYSLRQLWKQSEDICVRKCFVNLLISILYNTAPKPTYI